MGLDATKPVFGFPKKRDSNQSPQLQRLARKLQFSPVASLDMILSNKQIKKALISLPGLVCAFVIGKPEKTDFLTLRPI